MTTQELHSLYNDRIQNLIPCVLSQAKGDDDLTQEQCIGIYLALKENPYCTDRFLKTKATWDLIISTKKGRSVDNGFWNRDALDIIKPDQIEDCDVAANILKDMRRKPLDEQVIEKITLQEFLKSMTYLERRFVQYRIVGWSIRKIMKKLKISEKMLEEIKKSVRFKLKEAYA